MNKKTKFLINLNIPLNVSKIILGDHILINIFFKLEKLGSTVKHPNVLQAIM